MNTIGHEGTAQAGDGRTVLVADDDAAVRGFVATILRASGYRVLEAQTGDEALRFVEEELALVADLVMPPEGGLELVDALRRQIPGLIVEAHGGEIGVTSWIGEGSTFRVAPPAAASLAGHEHVAAA